MKHNKTYKHTEYKYNILCKQFRKFHLVQSTDEKSRKQRKKALFEDFLRNYSLKNSFANSL